MSVQFPKEGRLSFAMSAAGRTAEVSAAPKPDSDQQPIPSQVEPSKSDMTETSTPTQAQTGDYQEANFSASTLAFGPASAVRSDSEPIQPLYIAGQRYAANPNPIQTPQPTHQRLVPSDVYLSNPGNLQIDVKQELNDMIGRMDLPWRGHVDQAHEMALGLAEHGPLGVLAATVTASAIDFYIPTNALDLIPTKKLEELFGLAKVVKGPNNVSRIEVRDPQRVAHLRQTAHQQGRPVQLPPMPRPIIVVQAGTKGNWNPRLMRDFTPNTTYRVNGYNYNIDAQGRVESVTGRIHLQPADRHKSAQESMGHSGLPGDQGGHIIANALGGPGENINLFPQNGNFNMGRWRTQIEQRWQQLARQNHNVDVNIELIYPTTGNTRRPEAIRVLYTIDGGRPIPEFYTNTPGGGR